MPKTYDAIVIGAGQNGLTCACYLARAGLSASQSRLDRRERLVRAAFGQKLRVDREA